MADHFVDFNSLDVQRHWYKLRADLEHELQGATADVRQDYEVSVRLAGATIASEGSGQALRVPVAARWRDEIEQTIAYILVTDVEEEEPRIVAIGHGVAELLARWVQREVPIRAAPTFLYPETEVRWPDLPESRDETATAVQQEAGAAPA